jgi:hypothetical protein
MNDKYLDEAIDRAVRDMIRTDGSADVRARVLTAIDRSAARPWPWWRLAAGGTVAAAALTMFLLTGGNDRVAPPAHVELPRTPAVAEAPPRAVPVAPKPELPPAAPVRARTVATLPAAAPFEIPALEEPEPLAVDALPLPVVSTTELRLSPLTEIEDVRVDPLGPPRERD